MANQDKTRPMHKIMDKFGVPKRNEMGSKLGLRRRWLLLQADRDKPVGK